MEKGGLRLIIIEGLRLAPGQDPASLKGRAAKLLRRRESELLSLRILRRAIDAREEPVWVYTMAVRVRREDAVLPRGGQRRMGAQRLLRPEPSPPYRLPESIPALDPPPVVAGAGPAGLFAALVLASAGLRPILLERGKPVEERRRDVERFRLTGVLCPDSNIQFGEGGAGAFSDGKLQTGTRDPRHRFLLETLAACGAPPDILIDAKPHIGTDFLFPVLQNLRHRLTALGTDLRFGHTLEDLRETEGRVSELTVRGPEGTYALPCKALILAPGHSARDTFSMLQGRGVPMEAKPFAVGVRIEHLQADCDAAQYRAFAGHPGLPPASYKLSCHVSGGRGVFSFCVCPGGEVVPAASEPGGVATNGMSPYARDGTNINGGLLVGVTPADFGGDGPLAGIGFQRRLEQAAYALGGGGYHAPVQRVEDFLSGVPSEGPGRVLPTYRPGVTWTDLHACLPPFLTAALREALPLLGRKLRGFDSPDAVLTAVESRSSSPVRILRDSDTYQSPLEGLYPCGEGAGCAGGILSAAADGMRAAEHLCASFQETSASS